MCRLAVRVGEQPSNSSVYICVCVMVVVVVMMWQGRGLGDNHRFEEGTHSELTRLIEPLGKNKAGAMGRGGGTQWGGAQSINSLGNGTCPARK